MERRPRLLPGTRRGEAAGRRRRARLVGATWKMDSHELRTSGSDRSRRPSDQVGDLAIVYLRLAEPVPPGEEQVVQFGLAGGDPSFKVVEGERFVVTEQELERAVRVAGASGGEARRTVGGGIRGPLRQPDARLVGDASSSLPAYSGSSASYHCFALPRPAADDAADDGRVESAWRIRPSLRRVLPQAGILRATRVSAALSAAVSRSW